MANKDVTDPARMEKIVSLCKRRGFIFQAGELYGGLNGCWDYGPLGAELKRNLKDFWWRKTVQERDDVLGMDGAILTMEQVLVSSGHVGGFSDPMCDCLLSKARLRADQIPAADGHGRLVHRCETRRPPSGASSARSPCSSPPARTRWTPTRPRGNITPSFSPDKQISPKELELTEERREEVTGTTQFNPDNGSLLTEPAPVQPDVPDELRRHRRADRLPPPGDRAVDLRASTRTCSIPTAMKLPFGIAQIGKSFRNEINPRNFTFRSREFEQMEIEYFCHPDDGMRLTDEWLETRLSFYEEIGIPREKLHILDVPDGERAFYSKKTYDIEYEFPFGIQELEGVAYRTDYDLGVHQKGSGKPLEYFDEETKQKLPPPRRRTVRRLRPHRPRAHLRSLRRGNSNRRQGQGRHPHRAALQADHGTDQGRHLPAAQEERGAGPHRPGDPEDRCKRG